RSGEAAAYIFRIPDDCNENLVPDGCDITFGTSPDCNANATPDECDINRCQDDPLCDDCNSNGTPDGCERGNNLAPVTSAAGSVAAPLPPAQAVSLDATKPHPSCMRREEDRNGNCVLDECERVPPKSSR
ncbi:MAG: hypothetical protein GY842_15330, partial [bacterium]|nr:hypothetical protein [bacterium]